MASEKPLRLWNGRWEDGKTAFVAAYSRADAGRLLCQAAGKDLRGIDNELKDYFNQCWGDTMNGITPERGVWVAGHCQPLVRVV